MAEKSALPAVITVLTIAVIMLVGMQVVGVVGEQVDTEDRDETVLLDDAGTWVAIESYGSGTDETVLNSRGNGLIFTGASDSWMRTDSSIGLDLGENYSVSQGVWVDSGQIGENMTIVTLGDGDLMIRHTSNETDNLWQVWTWDASSGNEFVANVTASDPQNASVVQVTREDDTLTIYENASEGESVDLSGSGTAGVNLSAAGNFNGTIDETRIFQAALSDSQLQALSDDPVHPIGTGEEARIMFDEFVNDDEVRIHFVSGLNGETSNATLGTGFAGETMDEDGLLTSGDYDWRTRGPEIRPLEGERLGGHPIAFVAYTYDESGGLIADIASAMTLAAIIPIILIASVIVAISLKLRQ